jgi:rhodanese-related sulfurtransferase/CBS domain-containing protein
MPREIDRFEVQRLIDRGAQLVEVLPATQYERKHIAGAISLPLKDLGAKARDVLDNTRPVVTYCYDSLCDMSGRAAVRLETLGFTEVFNYQPSKVDWFGNSMAAEGQEAGRATIADVARRDVPTCGLPDTVAEVRCRIGEWDICPVIDDKRVVLGLVRREALAMEDDRRIGELMQEGPLTHRPDVTVEEMAEMLRKSPEARVLVTNADGTLVGVADPDDIERAAKESTHG